MKTSFVAFLRRNLAFGRLAILSNLEYRVNFAIDLFAQPILTTLIEFTLWIAVFDSVGSGSTFGGHDRANYLSYCLWAAFVGRITATWMYEFRMIEDINSGALNGYLARPMSFFEYYFSQFFTYKFLTTGFSLLVPVVAQSWLGGDFHYERVLPAISLVLYYVVLAHLMSFCVASLALFFNRVSTFTVTKNLALWLFSGELFPLDLMPEAGRKILFALPFSSAVYIPTGYMTGRVSQELFVRGFFNVTLGIAFFALIAYGLWSVGTRRYSGTGA